MTWEDYQTLHAEAAAMIEEELSQLMPTGGRGVTVQGGVVSLRQELPAAMPRSEDWSWVLIGRISSTIENREDGDVQIEASGLSPWQALLTVSLRGEDGYAGRTSLGNQFDSFLVVENFPWRRVRFEAVLVSRVMRWHQAEALRRGTPDDVVAVLRDPQYGGSLMRVVFGAFGYYGLSNTELPESERNPLQFEVPVVVGAQPTSFTVPVTDTGRFVFSLLRVERV